MEGDDAAPGTGEWLPEDVAALLSGPSDLDFAAVLADGLARWPSEDMVRAWARWRARARSATPPTKSPLAWFGRAGNRPRS